MSKWVRIEDSKPERYISVIAYCPDWCDSGYEICHWTGSKFEYVGQPNDEFTTYVEGWSYFDYVGLI